MREVIADGSAKEVKRKVDFKDNDAEVAHPLQHPMRPMTRVSPLLPAEDQHGIKEQRKNDQPNQIGLTSPIVKRPDLDQQRDVDRKQKQYESEVHDHPALDLIQMDHAQYGRGDVQNHAGPVVKKNVLFDFGLIRHRGHYTRRAGRILNE